MAKKPERILVEIDPDLKLALKAKLVLQGKTLKEWVEEQARRYLTQRP